MQNPSVQFVSVQSALPPGSQQPVLRDGMPVFVRVLQENGGGSYLVSFAGNRFQVQSERTLLAGQEFPAVLRVTDGRLLVVPQGQDGTTAQGTLLSQLAELGLPAGGASVLLVQFLEQGGFKIDVPLMRRALTVASRFPGKEKKAAEAALLLLQKGLEPTDSAVQALLDLFAGQGSRDGSTEQGSGGKQDGNDGDGTDFLSALFPDGSALRARAGLLTLMNQSAAFDRHWFLVPYEWSHDGLTASGMMRLLLDTGTSSLVRMVMDCTTLASQYFFVLYYEQDGLSDVRFCAEPPLAESGRAGAEHAVMSLLRDALESGAGGRSVSVRYDDNAALEGLCTVSEPPATVDGTV